MFARFRDENALIDPGLVMPDTPLLSDAALESTNAQTQNSPFYTLVLKNGRTLAWSEFGHSHGYPILYMHRQGGSRLEALFLHDAAKSAGFRLIAIDRPGLGESDFFVYKEPGALVDDYFQLLDHLDLPQVAVFSWGAGSQFALEMAARGQGRVSFLSLLSPRERRCALVNNRFVGLAIRFALRLLLSARTIRASRDDAHYLQRWREQMCYVDRQQIDDPEVGSLLVRIARESTNQGAAGLAQDLWFGLMASNIDACHLPVSELSAPVHVWSDSVDAHPDRIGAGITRHWVRRQGHLFIRQAAGDIFSVARRVAGFSHAGFSRSEIDIVINPGAAGPIHR